MIEDFKFFNNAWWLHVTLTPDLNKIQVFNNGIWKGFNGVMLKGGQFKPISFIGTNLLWKKVQKKPLKNKTSDKINKIIPNFNPFWTKLLWNPWYVDSRVTSRHHKNKIILIKIKENNNVKKNLYLNQTTNEEVIDNDLRPNNKGQGLIWTIWNGWKNISNRKIHN